MRTDEKGRCHLTEVEALSLVAPGERVHTFRQGGPALVGCDMDREDVETKIREHGAQLGGEQCVKLGHGLVIMDDHGPLFVEHSPTYMALLEQEDPA